MLWNDLVLHLSGINDCCQDIWFAEHSSHIVGKCLDFSITVVPTKNGICIEDKLTRSYMEDDFQVNEIQMINKYIKPTDQRSIDTVMLFIRLSFCCRRCCDWFHDSYLQAHHLPLYEPPTVSVDPLHPLHV